MSLSGHIKAGKGDFRLDAKIEFPAAGVSALFGPSGAGKTLCLRAIAGLEHFPGTTLNFKGAVWQGDDKFVPPHQRAVGYVFQEASLFEHLDVRANLAYGFRRLGDSEVRISLAQVVELFALGNLLHRKPHTLSGGERQRVAMGRALASNPQLLLMDEPLAGLDEKRKSEVVGYLDALVRELDIPLIYVSHSADEIARLAESLVYLEEGTIRGAGPVEEMFTRIDLDLSRARDAESIIEAVAVDFDDSFQLNTLEFVGGKILVPGIRLPAGTRFRLRVPARDVSLTLSEASDTSILNIFQATVDQWASSDAAQVVVRLDVAGTPLLAHVTRKSLAKLALEPGKQVFAQVKSVAVLT